MNERIRRVLAEHGRLATPVQDIPDDADLYRLGLTSHASVNVMLALEDEFDLEFPERLLRKETFQSIGAISAALEELAAKGAVGA